MSITIRQINEETYSIDGHLAHRNMSGQWQASQAMNSAQVSAFQRHLAATYEQETTSGSVESQNTAAAADALGMPSDGSPAS